jgi:hypothetical protein
MKHTLIALIATVIMSASVSVSEAASTKNNCKLKVYTTSPSTAFIVHYLRYSDYTLEQCNTLCASKPKLMNQVPYYEMVLHCTMKYLNEDGSITKENYNHLFSNPY